MSELCHGVATGGRCRRADVVFDSPVCQPRVPPVCQPSASLIGASAGIVTISLRFANSVAPMYDSSRP